MDEVKLYNSSAEREVYENMAALYAIVMSLEHLERAFARDSISATEYTSECSKLLLQYKTVSQIVIGQPDLHEFTQKYKLNCPAAIRRLEVGIPSTIEHGNANMSGNNAKYVAKSVQEFITTMDALSMHMTSVDKLHPLLTELLQSINAASFLPQDYRWKPIFRDWLIKLNKMKASDELDEDQERQLLFEVEQAYADFKNILESTE
ncbi:vacuolar protein sorting-associated protein 28 [Kickxella alabastrina]|uniref:Vacuolar protein-sorting-associated protein 28 n=1 Tax=Kickxella alabastrina TaxID=61397 RepID=A0ACC1IUS8_9FUNG|nr:vacuolar protein sorting-associated protein 28 [Kickxella alabastrina]KAI7820880.1 vacuolar protein sorting-associated protein 28 [Kickxella alabastrina]KAJ1901321.1 Vacuolar protein-sorting-associated protein 28 [Kickxella alabastrina]KAJ1939166.1 Vacuolar protein-sorting-associated protein 28 [Kickxella alabastrina]